MARKWPLHVVFKADARMVKSGLRTYRRYFIILRCLQKFAAHFHVKVEQFSIQYDHIHLLLRFSRRSDALNFFRVLAGQIAQNFLCRNLMTVTDTPEKLIRLWRERPFTRVVLGTKAYRTAQEYVRLNELEALGLIPHRKERLRGLSALERLRLREWSGP